MAERVGQGPFTEWYSTSDVVLQAKVVGDAHPRWKLTADGVVATGAGTGAPAAPATTLGTSATATTPGTVVKKVEIFNAAGTSLGFVAVYDAIT